MYRFPFLSFISFSSNNNNNSIYLCSINNKEVVIKMKFNVFHTRKSSSTTNRALTPESPKINVREEYANAFRTESYNDFWAHVLTLTNKNAVPKQCSIAERLPSYRLFAENLLDPDQPTITKILTSTNPQNHPENHSLLLDYFSETANASQLCGLLLKHIDQTRTNYGPLKTTFDSLETTSENHSPANHLPENHFPGLFDKLTEFSNCKNPFDSSSSHSSTFESVQAGCTRLLKRLELGRRKIRAKLRFIKHFKRGLAIKKLACLSAQVDAAAKGTYILNRDMETISRLVTRLYDEIEHVRAMVKFWLERRDVELKPSHEIVNRFKKNYSSFREQLDDLEEHLYLCFMTINRSRNLVMKELLELTLLGI